MGKMTKWQTAWFLLVGASLGMASAGQAQVDVSAWPTVRVEMSMTARDGSPVVPASGELTVEENGKSVDVGKVISTDSPQSVCLLIDVSGSVKTNVRGFQLAGERFLQQLPAEDDACVATFATVATLLQPMTKDRALLRAALEGPLQPEGGTALYDALLAVAQAMEKNAKYDRRVIVVLTDGEDNYSHLSVAELEHKLLSLHMPSIDFVRWNGTGRAPSGEDYDKDLSASTGGVTYTPSSPAAFVASIDKLREAMSHRFAFEYTSPMAEANGHIRKLRVRGPKGDTPEVVSAFLAPAE